MTRLGNVSGMAKATLCALLLAATLGACGEDGKTAPDTCAEPPLPLFDIQQAGAPSVDNPCVTKPGHAISAVGTADAGAGGA
jgi:hypothetical protein